MEDWHLSATVLRGKPNVDLWPDLTLNLKSSLDHKAKPQTEEVTMNNVTLLGLKMELGTLSRSMWAECWQYLPTPTLPPPPAADASHSALYQFCSSHISLCWSHSEKKISGKQRCHTWEDFTTYNYSVVGPDRPAIGDLMTLRQVQLRPQKQGV